MGSRNGFSHPRWAEKSSPVPNASGRVSPGQSLRHCAYLRTQLAMGSERARRKRLRTHNPEPEAAALTPPPVPGRTASEHAPTRPDIPRDSPCVRFSRTHDGTRDGIPVTYVETPLEPATRRRIHPSRARTTPPFHVSRSIRVSAVVISARFSMTLFLRGHRCGACGLRMRTRNMCRGLSEPGFETGLAQSRVIPRK